MSDTVHLCDRLGQMVRTADPATRRAFARELDAFWERYPDLHDRIVSGEAPGLLHFILGALEAACAEKRKPKPDLRVVPFSSEARL